MRKYLYILLTIALLVVPLAVDHMVPELPIDRVTGAEDEVLPIEKLSTGLQFFDDKQTTITPRKTELAQRPEALEHMVKQSQFDFEQTRQPQRYDSRELIEAYKNVIIQKSHFNITFANDIFNNTDSYYTNGIRFDFIHPALSKSPLAFLLHNSRHAYDDLYGLSLVQNIYTATNPDLEQIVPGDRPFSAYLTIGQYKVSVNRYNGNRISSGLNIGMIGPSSLGGMVQSSIHEVPALGWKHQIKNDLIVDYFLDMEHQIQKYGPLQIDLLSGLNLGSLYNKAYLGIGVRAGNFPTYCCRFLAPGEHKPGPEVKYALFARASNYFVGYDATLQGGLMNRSSDYTISAENLNRNVFMASAGFTITWSKYTLKAEQFYLSPEFKTGRVHRWVNISTSFSL